MPFLPNVVNVDGLRVVLVKEDRESIMVQAMLGSGSREEDNKTAGEAHFLEHFVFKGTKKFPGMFDISDAISGVGGVWDAYTSNNEMGFWARVAKHKIDLALKTIGQLVTEPLLPAQHFEEERGTIVEELRMYEDLPENKAFEEQWKMLYGKTNMGRPIIGTKESLEKMTVTNLSEYMDKWFLPENTILGVVGNWDDENKLIDKIRQEFGPLIGKKGKLPERDKFVWPKQNEAKLKLVTRKTEQANLSIGLPGLPLGHPKRYVMSLTNIILGGGTLSRLFKEVRWRRGWAYSVGSETESFPDSGALLVGGGLPKEKVADAVKLILDIMWGIGGTGKWGITPTELEVAKECYKGRVSLNYDKPNNVLGYALSGLMFENKIHTPQEHMEAAQKVTLDDVRELCREIFVPEKMSLALVGDYEKMPFTI